MLFSYSMPPVHQGLSSSVLILEQNSPQLQGEAGKALKQREAESQQYFVGQKQDGATVTLRRLDVVLLDQDEQDNEYLPPTEYASQTTRVLIERANAEMKRNFPQGSVAADGSGGVRIHWQVPGREIRLIVPAHPKGRTYIYHEQEEEYATEKTVTSINLAHWLDRFVEK